MLYCPNFFWNVLQVWMTGKDVYLQMTWSWPDKTWNILCSYCLQWKSKSVTKVKVNLEITTFFFYLRFPYCPNFFWFGVVVGTASSFFFFFFWKSRFELFLVCKQISSKIKWTKNRVLTDAVWIFVKNEVHSLFPNIGIRRKAMQRLFFHNLALHSVFVFGAHLSFGFCVDVFTSLVNMCTNQWVGLERQCCKSRRWSSSVEAVLIHTITSVTTFTWTAVI